MARRNTPAKNTVTTHEDAHAFGHLKPLEQLRRSVMSCLLWEDQFYEDGKTIADRIAETSALVTPAQLASVAIEARKVFNLRHVPLLLLRALVRRTHDHNAKHGLTAETIGRVISRVDELAEFLSLYWATNDGRKIVPRQMRYGLQKAFAKFDEYQLAKYDRDDAVKLRDVLRISRPKPINAEQAALWKRVKERSLKTPDTWEVALSGGADKKETFERLLREDSLGYLALLRNLRKMAEVNVDADLIKAAIIARKGAQHVFPFRYVAAARAAPQFERHLDQALLKAIEQMPTLDGKTVVMVDVSRSMNDMLSQKSDMMRIDAAAALGAMFPGDVRLFSFSDHVVEVPPRRGMAGVDAIINSQMRNGTRLFDAVDQINRNVEYHRLIVITDEQATDPQRFAAGWIQGNVTRLPDPKKIGYMINVGANKNGVGYGKWVHIDGFAEAVIRYIYELEHIALQREEYIGRPTSWAPPGWHEADQV
jgi:60 kDa SS-A/Ro ribonucleoprotein